MTTDGIVTVTVADEMPQGTVAAAGAPVDTEITTTEEETHTVAGTAP